jgi:hypothetical protein
MEAYVCVGDLEFFGDEKRFNCNVKFCLDLAYYKEQTTDP